MPTTFRAEKTLTKRRNAGELEVFEQAVPPRVRHACEVLQTATGLHSDANKEPLEHALDKRKPEERQFIKKKGKMKKKNKCNSGLP